jgi:GTP-binding protein
MFVDQVSIEAAAGKGGDGAVSFLKEAFRPRGGPDGGDGGDGGSIVLVVSTHRSSLRDISKRRTYSAHNGRPGGTTKCTGRGGADVVLELPPGTLVFDVESGELVVDMTEVGQRVVLAKGGKGGKGNARFATALNQAPRTATRGELGGQGSYRLELKLIAEVGIVGLPNAGKSTFISRVSAARPKIASYPFTTLVPNLGVVTLKGSHRELILADIPGLIEGASDGKGLGDDFLRHVERTRVLFHLVDGAGPEFGGAEPVDAYRTIRQELERYAGAALQDRHEVVALNKVDALAPEEAESRRDTLSKAIGKPVLLLSGVSGQGCDEALQLLADALDAV